MMPRSGWMWPAIALLSSTAISLVVFMDLQSPLRTPLALWFIMFCPGMSLVHLLRIKSRLAAWMLATGLSIGLSSATAIAMTLAERWSLQVSTAILVAFTVLAAILDLVIVRKQLERSAG